MNRKTIPHYNKALDANKD